MKANVVELAALVTRVGDSSLQKFAKELVHFLQKMVLTSAKLCTDSELESA